MIRNHYRSKQDDNKAIALEVVRNDQLIATLRVDPLETQRLREHSWSINAAGYGYCTKCGILIHRFILNAPAGLIVDHRNRQPLDNVRTNLRLGDHKLNMANRGPNARRKLELPIPIGGIGLAGDRWSARRPSGSYLGRFDHLYDACLARLRWELEHQGEWSPKHRHWVSTLPMRFRTSWLPEFWSLDNQRYSHSALHRAFFNDYYAKNKKDAIRSKLRRYRTEYRQWQDSQEGTASNV